jgi:methyltransferase
MPLSTLLSSQVAYTLLVALIVLERLGELVLSRRNASAVLARGGFEVGRGHYPVMVAVHTLFLIAQVLEVWLLERPFIPVLAGASLLALAVSMALRYWAIAHLGDRWTTRILIERAPRVRTGPYRFLRHPNYVAVVLEIAAMPLVHTAWCTALVFSLANAALLAVRIRTEERALGAYCGPQDTPFQKPGVQESG